MKKIWIGIMAIIAMISLVSVPVMAAGNQPEAAILKDCASKSTDSKGGGIECILSLVVDIMTIGIGILGVIGISVVGIQYLTAGGNEEQTRKAKRRMNEIIIGLAAYAVIYALLKWLLPNFKL